MRDSKSLKIRRVYAKPCCLLPPLLLLMFWLGVSTVGVEGISNANFYTAGVVEFRPTISGMTSSEMVAEHLQAYVDIIESAEASDMDIIVFPEGTLNNGLQLTYVPSEKDGVVPCLANDSAVYADFLIQLSCAARRERKYLVINLTEKEDCGSAESVDPRPCAVSGLNIYNTNVVFDREGRVVSRYRKVHVYVEKKNTTLYPEYAIFDTDFGVRFGHFICFDILFYTPAQELVQEYGLTDFIFTSLFYSELPFLTATQLQQGWAWGNNVNLLAAGASFPQSGITGTGIYAGQQGALITTMVKGEGERRLYKAQVPKIRSQSYLELGTKRQTQPVPAPAEASPNGRHLDGIHLLKDPQIHNYNSVLVDGSKSSNIFEELCHDDICCTFDVVTEVSEVSDISNISAHYKHRLGVFSGRRTYEKEEWSDIKVCALYTCTSDDIQSCGVAMQSEQFQSSLTFKHVHIKGSFPKSPKLLIMPTTIDDQLNPLQKETMHWNQMEKSSSYDVDIILVQEHRNLMTFGIYAMYYEKSAAAPSLASHTLGVCLLCYLVLRKLLVFLRFK